MDYLRNCGFQQRGRECQRSRRTLTGTAAHFQQLVKEQSCGGNSYGNVVGGVQVNRTNDRPNSKHIYGSLYSQDVSHQEVADPRQGN